jgi:hypothetical protein
MKLLSRNHSNGTRPSAYLLAAMVVGLALSCSGRALAVGSTPNASQIFYSLAANTNTGAIVPAANVPVLVMGTCITNGVRGVGQVTLVRIPGNFLEWVGLNSTAGANITQGFSGAAGVDIVEIDFAGQVVVEVNSTDTFRVRNNAAAARSGYVTMIW